MTIEASITLKSKEVPAVGRERIRLLECVARSGSITAGAKAVGLSYKAAWDALDAMANLFGKPLLETRAGGRAGGGASLTATGIRVVEAFHRLEAELTRVLGQLEPELAGSLRLSQPTRLDEVGVRDGLGTDETTFEVRVDDARGVLSVGSALDWPRSTLVWANRQERDVTE